MCEPVEIKHPTTKEVAVYHFCETCDGYLAEALSGHTVQETLL